jgi:hypothetical protein
MPPADEVQTQRLDERALPGPWDSGDADADRTARVRQQPGQEILGQRLVARAARLDQRQGAGQDGHVPGPHPGEVLLRRQLAAVGATS